MKSVLKSSLPICSSHRRLQVGYFGQCGEGWYWVSSWGVGLAERKTQTLPPLTSEKMYHGGCGGLKEHGTYM